MSIVKNILLCTVLLSTRVLPQSISGSFFLNGGNAGSNESFACTAIVGETIVGFSSNEAFFVQSGSQFVKGAAVTGINPAPNNTFPSRFSLSQNYPNPFNPSTTIRYDLPKASGVTLRIFNTLGQELEVLVDRDQEAGYHQVRWSTALPSGIYFYRLQAGDFVEIKKMLLLK